MNFDSGWGELFQSEKTSVQVNAVPCHAFCMWHWPIGKNLDLSFIWGHHHLYLVSILWISVDQLNTSYTAFYTVLTRPNKVETAVHGWILAFQFGFYHVVAPLSFLRSISLAPLFTSFSKHTGPRRPLLALQWRVYRLGSSRSNSPLQAIKTNQGNDLGTITFILNLKVDLLNTE